MNHDPVNHPTHYTSHPSGVECITITEHMGFCERSGMRRADVGAQAVSVGELVTDLRRQRLFCPIT